MVLLLALMACSSVNTPIAYSSSVALYSDHGVEPSCITATVNMFEWMGLSIQEVSSEEIRTGCLENFELVCFPGGDMYQYSQSLSTEGISRVRSFISDGGGYIGICGGGYFAAEEIYWMGNVSRHAERICRGYHYKIFLFVEPGIGLHRIHEHVK